MGEGGRHWYRQRFGLGFYRRGVRIDEYGLTELFWLTEPEEHLWDEVEDVEYDVDRAVVRTRRGELVIDCRVVRWRQFVDRIAERTGCVSGSGDVDQVVPVETVAEWLGIEPGEQLACQVQRVSDPTDIKAPGLVLGFYFTLFAWQHALTFGGRAGIPWAVAATGLALVWA